MIALRCGLLLLATLLALAALGASAPELQPSALRLAATAIVGLLAPLWWPGMAATPWRTAGRVLVWSGAAAGVAAAAPFIVGHPVRPLARIAVSCGMLLLMLLVAHAAAAALEARLRGAKGSADSARDEARELAGRMVALALALSGSMPLWLGPLAELLSVRHAGVIDAVVGLSPLTHLAVASGNDLLRNQWLYQHANLASLQLTYPGLAELAGSYATALSLLALTALAFRSPRRSFADATRKDTTTEKSK
jgi:hypothetical protein